MRPVVKRILLHGGATAVVLAAVGLLFAELAGMWAGAGATKPGGPDLNFPINESLRYRIPLMMAFWGFVFVAVSELVLHRLRWGAPSKPPAPPPDETEKLLNELLAQAEAKMAAEARGEGQGDRGKESEREEVEKPAKPST